MIEPNKRTAKYISSKILGYVDKSVGIQKFQQDIKKRYGINKIFRFDLGDNTDGPSNKVLEALEHIKFSKMISEYPDSNYLMLKNELALLYDIATDNISIGAGCSDIIKNINMSWLEKGDSAIFTIPSFYFIENSILEYGGIPTHVHLREKNFSWTEDTARELMIVANYVRPKLIWLVTPNNPTGVVTPLNDIIRIIENNQNSIIVVDEAYGEYVDEKSAISIVKNYDNLLVLRTFSKAYGMAGLRLGYCIGSKELIKILEEMRLEFPVVSISERLGILALRDKEHIENTKIKLAQRKKTLLDKLEKIDNIEYVPSRTNIMLIKLKNGTSLYKELLKRGIIVAKMNGILKEYVRITIKNEEENDILINNLMQIY